MPSFDTLFPLIPLAILGYFAWRYFRRGSIVGALLGGRIVETIGEIKLASSSFGSQTLQVHRLDPGGGSASFVALADTSKAALGASVVPIKLSGPQANELAALLQRASAVSSN